MKSRVMLQVVCVDNNIFVCVFSRITVPKVVFIGFTNFLVDSISNFLPRFKPVTASERSMNCVVMVFIHYYEFWRHS